MLKYNDRAPSLFKKKENLVEFRDYVKILENCHIWVLLGISKLELGLHHLWHLLIHEFLLELNYVSSTITVLEDDL